MATTLHVCTTCRGSAAGPSASLGSVAGLSGCGDCTASGLEGCAACPLAGGAPSRPGQRLAEALARLPVPEGVRVVPVECLSACTQGCAVALSAPGKWSYVYGRLGPEDAGEVLAGAGLHAASPDGLIPWRERPEIFRKQSLARIPPQAIPDQE